MAFVLFNLAAVAALVGIDQWGAMAEVMRLVVEYGHRRALYFAGPQEWRDAGTRLAAWRQLCAEHAVECVVEQCESWESAEAYTRMNHVLEDFGSRGAALPSLVVTANDSQAVGVMRALHEHRLRIPQDVSLVGFDVLFFVPTGYQCIEQHFTRPFASETQIGDYLYDLRIPDFNTVQESGLHSIRKLFGRSI